MKKVYLLFVLLIMGLSSFAQTYTLASGTSIWNGTSWSGGIWYKDGTPNLPPPNYGAETIIVSSDAIMELNEQFNFNSLIIIENGGTLKFVRTTGGGNSSDGGSLVMSDSDSEIIFKKGSTVSSSGSSQENKNYITIGTATINGTQINEVNTQIQNSEEGIKLTEASLATTSGGLPLPVILHYFTAKVQNQSVEINWASSKAWDFSHYELERSANGTTFEYVASIDAAEFSNETTEYTYADNQPLFGTSYYRLKAVDIDGAFEYKEMAAVKFGAESFNVYPNPSAGGFINVDWSHATEGATLILTDNTGRAVRNVSLNGTNNIISTEGLTGGMYVLTIKSAAGSKQTQLIIK